MCAFEKTKATDVVFAKLGSVLFELFWRCGFDSKIMMRSPGCETKFNQVLQLYFKLGQVNK